VSTSDESNLAEIFRIRNLKQVNILACKEARERRETRILESGGAGDRKSAFRADRCRSICRRSRSSKRKFRISMTGLPKDISDDYLRLDNSASRTHRARVRHYCPTIYERAIHRGTRTRCVHCVCVYSRARSYVSQTRRA